MVNDTNATGQSRDWFNSMVGPVVDVVEDYILGPVDDVVAPRWERHQAEVAHRRVSTARHTLATRVLWWWPTRPVGRARLLHAWSGLEQAAAYTRRSLHEHHTGTPDGSDGCCEPLARLYLDRAEILRALAVMEEQTLPVSGREPNFTGMPSRIRRLAGDRLAAMSCTHAIRDRAEAAEQVIEVLAPQLGAAVEPIRRVYIS